MGPFWNFFFVASFTALAQFTMSVYVPSMPAIGHAFQVPPADVQLSLTLYLLGFALTQLVYGPLTDRFGRRKIILGGLTLFSLGAFINLMSPSIEYFFIGCLVEGIGVGGSSVISRAIMRDLYHGQDLIRVNAYIAMSWGLIFISAPFIGGSIQETIGWRGNFALLLGIGLTFILLVITRLIETQPKESIQPIRLNVMFHNYRELLTSRIFMGYTLCLFILYGVIVAFNAMTPYLLQTRMHYTAFSYGVLMAFMSFGYMLGSFTTSRLIQVFPVSQLIKTGFICMTIVTAIMTVLALMGWMTIWLIVLPTFLFLFSMGLVYPNCMASVFAPFSHIAGNAGALFNCLLFSGGLVASKIVTQLPENSPLPLASVFLTQTLVAATIYFFFFMLWQEKTRRCEIDRVDLER